MSKYTSIKNKQSNKDISELVNNNNEYQKHKSVSRDENNKQKDQ